MLVVALLAKAVTQFMHKKVMIYYVSFEVLPISSVAPSLPNWLFRSD